MGEKAYINCPTLGSYWRIIYVEHWGRQKTKNEKKKTQQLFKLGNKGYFILPSNNYHRLNATILLDGKNLEDQIRDKIRMSPLTADTRH